ncbi:tetratricopeptide repeat protein [Streptomyces arenae]|uniref:tetratricopeptide repeat protein n=1 Tax=Streptomyces arenae TaxID=29301 RepID=UPI002658770A|nr:tetratricopeptide repeat protein [Streptomyces arenae]MCG7207293.1 tetratricopeptide repeat protein [Streptomyces arenae]
MTHAHDSERAAALTGAASAAIEAITGSKWPTLLAEALREIEATWQESAEVCADVAWQARAAGNSALVVLTPEHVTDAGPHPVIWRTYRHLYLSTLRYDFRCRVIESLMNKVPVSVLNEDAYSEALYGFARLGQSRSDGLAVMHRVLVAAPGHPKTLHVLLHGVWLGTFLPGRAPMLLALVGLLPEGGLNDPIALFRMASARRSLGQYPEALTAIDHALELLPPGELAVHANLVRERALITMAHDLALLIPKRPDPTP